MRPKQIFYLRRADWVAGELAVTLFPFEALASSGVGEVGDGGGGGTAPRLRRDSSLVILDWPDRGATGRLDLHLPRG